MKEDYNRSQTQSSPGGAAPELLFAGTQSATRQEILKMLPEREICDRLIAQYLSRKAIRRMFSWLVDEEEN